MKISSGNKISLSLNLAVAAAIGLLTTIPNTFAANAIWNGSASTDFETPGNWTGGTGGGGAIAPAPANNLTTDIGLFAGAVTANQPSLSISRSITGLSFTTATGGWNLGSSSSSNVLTLGASGISSTNTSGTNTISANLTLGATQTFLTGTGGTLLSTGSITMGASGAPVTQTLSLGSTSATQNGTITLNPSTGNSINLYSNAASGLGAIAITTGGTGTPKTVNFGSGANSTNSTNILSGSVGGGIRTIFGSTLNVNSGTWVTNSVGSGNSNTGTGAINLTGGTLKSGAGRFILSYGTTATNGAGTLNVNGGAYIQTNAGDPQSNSGYLAIGNQGFVGTAAVASMNVSAGYVDIAPAQNGAAIASAIIGLTAGTTTQSNTALYNQSGGVAQFAVTTASNVFTGAAPVVTTTNTGISIGGGVVATNNASSALTLAGGRLNVNGTLTGGGATTLGTNSIQNLNLVGGTLTAQGINVVRLGSSSTATATSNQVAASTNIGTLVNYGTNLAPGGSLIGTSTDSFGNVTVTTTATTGRTSVTGNYLGQGSGTLSFNLGGTTLSTSFQDAVGGATGNFSNMLVSGTTTLADTLTVFLLGGYTPTGSDSFVILNSTGALTGTFTNVAFGSTVSVSDGSGTFQVNQVGNTVVLNNFAAIPEPSTYASLVAGFGLLIGTQMLRRKKIA